MILLKKIAPLPCFLIAILSGYAQNNDLNFIQNKGQWEDNIIFKADIPNGNLYLEKHTLTYSLYNSMAVADAHDPNTPTPKFVQAHAYKINFLKANKSDIVTGINPDATNYNYFIGNDKKHWASNVKSFNRINYQDLYKGVDMAIYVRDGYLKYDFIVAPNSNVNQIQMQYSGMDKLILTSWGKLEITTTVQDIIEQNPVAYQMINGAKIYVPCVFSLADDVVGFEFPKSYNHYYPLIIDPVLVFASFTGSTANNFGCTATYDNDGDLYGGGTIFSVGYPTTLGAYQISFNGGNIDMAITKFSPDGTSLIYSTYIGGSGNETPHSLIVNNNNELCILGTTGNATFPTTAGAFQTVFNGGTTWTSSGYGFSQISGTDIVISKLSFDGSMLVASTYIGGTGNDGMNSTTTLSHNYGDPFRGEINVDDMGNIYVASCTESVDFPTSPGAPQPSLSGMRDGIVFKMDPALSTIIWSTYIGGTNNDNAYSLELGSGGESFVCGGTLSSDFPTTVGSYQPTLSGSADGFVTEINASGTAFSASTYYGTPVYDQGYFVQLDLSDNVYVLGQTDGNYPVYPGAVYNNPGSGQFIHKFDHDLTTTKFSTVIGTGSGTVDISPTAFLVNKCGHIYVSGWGGAVNLGSFANQSTTLGLPVTSNAFQATTDGSDFYLLVLDTNASSVIYATFFGGNISHEHVDGGTSRFDKNGIVYEAVCAGCGGYSDFPTSPGAWSNVNNASCNLGVFKFDLNDVISNADFSVLLGTCQYPMQVQFTNTSIGAIQYLWDYGDGTTSTSFDDPHLFTAPGTYFVTLISTDSNTCMISDTMIMQIILPYPPLFSLNLDDTTCQGQSVQLDATSPGIISYQWSPPENFNNPNISNPIATLNETTTFTVSVVDSNGCASIANVTAYVYPPPLPDAGPDIFLDIGNESQILQSTIPQGSTYYWEPPTGLSCINCPNPIANPDNTTTYYLHVYDQYGCSGIDSVTVFVWPALYVPNAFTPNNDEVNDAFYAIGRGIKDFEMFIYNRWGQLIFHSEDLDFGWDGLYKNKIVQNDVYVWRIIYNTDIEPDHQLQKIGHVTVLR